MTDNQAKQCVSIAQAGLNRFFDEGVSRWPDETLRPLFLNTNLEHPYVQQALAGWQLAGYITLNKTPDCYLVVHTVIP